MPRKKEKKDYIVKDGMVCPYCKKSSIITVKKVIIKKGVPAIPDQMKIQIFVDKDDQKKITDIRK